MPNTDKPKHDIEQSRAVQDFIKAIYALQQGLEATDRVSTNALKDARGITAPSVTDMAKRLVESGLVDYRKYYGLRLTDEGESLALRIIRRHRLLELYLVQELGYALHEVHDEADALEHAVSDRFVEAIADKLGHPQFDPHGDPIPSAEGQITRRELQPLSDLPLDTQGRVARFISNDSDMLQHTLDRGFKLHVAVQVTARDPFDGPLTIQLGEREIVIGHAVAEKILIELDDDRTPAP